MTATTEDENKELVHEYLAAQDNKNLEAIPALLADDFSTTYTDPNGEEKRLDVDDLMQALAGFNESFSKVDIERHETVAEDDWVITRISISGVHEGEYRGIAPTGNQINADEFLSFRIENGAIVEINSVADYLTVLRQLGADLPIEG